MCIPEVILLPAYHDHSVTALPRIHVFPHEEGPHRRSTQIVREKRRASAPVNIVHISPRRHQPRSRRTASEGRSPSPERRQRRSGFAAGQQASQKERERLAIEAKQAAAKNALITPPEAAGQGGIKNAIPSAAAAPAPPSHAQAPVPAPPPPPPPEQPLPPPPVPAPSPPRSRAEKTLIRTGPTHVIHHRRRRRRRSPSDESVSSSASYRAVKRKVLVIWGRVSGLERWRDEVRRGGRRREEGGREDVVAA